MTRTRIAALVIVLAGAFAGHAQAAGTTTAPSPTKGVVLVETNLAYEGASAAGTGIVLTSSGEVMTNNHVIRGATTINVVMPATHVTYPAHVIGYDISDDIALIKVDGAPKLATATRGNSMKLKIGQPTRAVGNANGGGRLVITKGTVTALQQSIVVSNEEGGTARLSGLIKTSALLVPGDSGGPLIDSLGHVIGVDAAGSTNQAGEGYAIPINRAYSLVKQMEAGTASSLVHIGKTAFLGITVSDASGSVVVGQILPGTAAEAAGLAANEVVTSLDGKNVATLDDIRTILFSHHPGDAIAVGYLDLNGQAATATLTLGDGPPQ
jgi:S1-C subfamily serine protease